MKGQAETTELLTWIGIIVVLIALIPVIIPIVKNAIESLAMASPDVISKDLASLISVSAAATKDLKVEYDPPGSDSYDVSIENRMITVSRGSGNNREEASAPIVIDAVGSLESTDEFKIEKKIEGSLERYYLNGELLYTFGRSGGKKVDPSPVPAPPQTGPGTDDILELWDHRAHFVLDQNPVPLPGGNSGHREAFAVHRSDISSSTIYMYHRCFNPLPVICLSISDDNGDTFSVNEGVIIDTDDVFAVSPSVAFINGRWVMVYEEPPEGIHWTTSLDGKTWTKRGALFSDSYRATPSVYNFDNEVYVFYAEKISEDELLVSFHSGDGMNSLEPHGDYVLVGSDAWELGAVSMPRIFYSQGYYWMVYEGGTLNFHSGHGPIEQNVFGWGIARSPDLVNWEKYDWNPIMRSTDEQSCGPDMPQPFIDPNDGTLYVYYTSDDSLNVIRDKLVLGNLCEGMGPDWHEINHQCVQSCSSMGGNCYQTKYCPSGSKIGLSWDCASCCS
ncbi:MAG: hypothetical protein GF368_04665 [Candidatus Aenigmarchaeota archaeon]|nr:hypothetical protein [Candidatus Aenigmarchaeota archaeon]